MKLPHSRRTPPGRLSQAELRILAEVARGRGLQAAATRLGLTLHGVKAALLKSRRALHARTTGHLIAIAIRTRQLPPDIAAGTEVTP